MALGPPATSSSRIELPMQMSRGARPSGVARITGAGTGVLDDRDQVSSSMPASEELAGGVTRRARYRFRVPASVSVTTRETPASDEDHAPARA